MFKLENIMVTTDLSENSRAALPFAVALAKQNKAQLHLAYVEEPPSIYPTDDSMTLTQLDWPVVARKEREQGVRKQAEELAERESLSVVAHLKEGAAADKIIETAREVHADCIVMSTHGLGGIARLVFGSVTERVLRESPCPVLCVKPRETPFASGPMLLTTDLSEESLNAVPYATAFAKQQDCELHIVFVLEDQLYVPPDGVLPPNAVDWMIKEHQSMEKQLQQLAADLRVQHGVKVVPHVRHGKAAAEIRLLASEIKAGCLILATHGRSGLSRLMLGSVAEDVIRSSICPVLAVRNRVVQGADVPIHSNVDPVAEK